MNPTYIVVLSTSEGLRFLGRKGPVEKQSDAFHYPSDTSAWIAGTYHCQEGDGSTHLVVKV